MVDERILAERLISYDTSRAEELVAAAGFVKGWLESRDIEVLHHDHNGLPVLVAGRCLPIIDQVYSLHDAVQAHAHMESGDHIGKIVLRVD